MASQLITHACLATLGDVPTLVEDGALLIEGGRIAARGALQPILLGTGLAPFAALFGRLKRAGWNGWMCIEEASFQGRDGVEAAVRFVRRAWSEA